MNFITKICKRDLLVINENLSLQLYPRKYHEVNSLDPFKTQITKEAQKVVNKRSEL